MLNDITRHLGRLSARISSWKTPMADLPTYVSGRSPEVIALLNALGISAEGVVAVNLIVEPNRTVRVQTEHLVTADELGELAEWVLKFGIKAEPMVEGQTDG